MQEGFLVTRQQAETKIQWYCITSANLSRGAKCFLTHAGPDIFSVTSMWFYVYWDALNYLWHCGRRYSEDTQLQILNCTENRSRSVLKCEVCCEAADLLHNLHLNWRLQQERAQVMFRISQENMRKTQPAGRRTVLNWINFKQECFFLCNLAQKQLSTNNSSWSLSHCYVLNIEVESLKAAGFSSRWCSLCLKPVSCRNNSANVQHTSKHF